jgi:hypothetical protein
MKPESLLSYLQDSLINRILILVVPIKCCFKMRFKQSVTFQILLRVLFIQESMTVVLSVLFLNFPMHATYPPPRPYDHVCLIFLIVADEDHLPVVNQRCVIAR